MAKPLKKIVASNVRRLRTISGLSQQALAQRCKLSVRYISKVENDPPDITTFNLERIAKGLGVPVAELVQDHGHLETNASRLDADAIKYTIRVLEAALDANK